MTEKTQFEVVFSMGISSIEKTQFEVVFSMDISSIEKTVTKDSDYHLTLIM